MYDADSDGHQYCDTHRHGNIWADVNGDVDVYRHGDSDKYQYADEHSDFYTDSCCFCDGHRNGNTAGHGRSAEYDRFAGCSNNGAGNG